MGNIQEEMSPHPILPTLPQYSAVYIVYTPAEGRTYGWITGRIRFTQPATQLPNNHMDSREGRRDNNSVASIATECT